MIRPGMTQRSHAREGETRLGDRRRRLQQTAAVGLSAHDGGFVVGVTPDLPSPVGCVAPATSARLYSDLNLAGYTALNFNRVKHVSWVSPERIPEIPDTHS